MTPEALSRLTWTVDDRRAWLAAYHRAREIAAERDALRAVQDPWNAYRDAMVEAHHIPDARPECLAYQVGRHSVTGFINDGPDCYCADCRRRLNYGSCDVCDTDRHSVHVDRLGADDV